MKFFERSNEGNVIQLGILVYWTAFWFLNSVDKIINQPLFLWVGKDRVAQFEKYFSSIGIEDPAVAMVFLIFVAIAEIAACVLLGAALVKFLKNKKEKAHRLFFWGTFVGLAIFSFFAIGDQIFGDRAELWEHTTFWMAIVISWGAYNYYPKLHVSKNTK
jgi:hypothetical protein